APPAPSSYRALPRLRLREGEDGADLRFESLGYAEAARASYATFGVLKRDGVIPRGCRFQVSLPTPLAPVSAFVALEDQELAERAYEPAMAHELGEILASIPHDQLALQWDTNFEFGMLGGDVPVWFPDVKAGILERLIRISRLVPPDVELGFHFCSGHDEQTPRHGAADMAPMVDIANALAASLGRPLNWIHMPVARERTDGAFVRPLRELRLHPETELYLGVLHAGEPEEDVRRRVEAAHEFADEFGVATPCGWGRLALRHLPELLDAHVRFSRPVAAAAEAEAFSWGDFARILDEDWVEEPVGSFGLHFDTVE